MSGHEGERRYRVAQWATGNVGTRALQAVLEHPQMSLVGLWVHSDAKVGRDAGELAGLGRETGVKATRSVDDILAQEPDCVLYMPHRADLDDVRRLLEAGVNVVTSVADFHDPESLDPAVRSCIDEACRAGGASFYATGSSPGFITAYLPLALTTLVRRLDGLTIDEYADMSSRASPEMIFGRMGFGKPPSDFSQGLVAHVRRAFGPALKHLADSLSVPLERIEAHGEFGTARERVQIACGVLEPGTVAALRMVVTGLRGGEPLMRFRANWYATTELEQDWDLRPTGWRVQIEGDTPLDVAISFPWPAERYAQISPGLTAHPVVNAVPAVCEAAPGLLTSADLRIFPMLS